MEKYQPNLIEPKWQKKWFKDNIFASNLEGKNKYYVLAEFAYPSGDLHMGHWFTFSGSDIFARFKRMQGYNVFFPNGFDAFGLPAENAAIQRKIHPQDWTESNIKQMKKQFVTMGASSTFDHEVITSWPEYYKWNQWIFLKMFERGLAYKDKFLSNWCETCQTVLANEGVENGTCWRCHKPVVLKEVKQWFFKITQYADRLIWPLDSARGKPGIDWPKPVRETQNAWIGKSEGIEIEFRIEKRELKIKVFTVFPETVFGVTYLVLAPEHPLVGRLTIRDYKEKVEKYIKESQKKSELERTALDKTKTGVFTGSYCLNPVNEEKVPIWVADYVIGSYGTGAVMGVPGSDRRDFQFAQKYDLPIIRVIGRIKNDQSQVKIKDDVLEEGWIVNSGQFNGLKTPYPAKEKFKDWLEKKGFGKRKIQYHLHDWSISRQRYWGTPIPIIYCPKCGLMPVPYEDLPVELPYDVDYTPQGKPPLASNEKWLKVKCPKCQGEAQRDAETMDTFVDSSWYFLRYVDPENAREIFDKKIVKKWLPVDIYFGGSEHNVGHTLYSRFFAKFFFDLGLISFDEYAQRRVNHGIVLGPDGEKMSKSRGNVVNADDEIRKFGADTVRVHLTFFMPYDGTGPWVSDRLSGSYRFLQRVWGLFDKVSPGQVTKEDNLRMHKTIKKVSEDIESIKFNTAVASLMGWLNYLSAKKTVTGGEYKTLLLLLAPFAPHMTEELYQKLKVESGKLKKKFSILNSQFSIHLQSWPKFDNKYLEEEEVTIVVEVNGKMRDTLRVESGKLRVESYIKNKAREREKVKKYLQNKAVEKVIYVPGKILNFVVED